MISLAPHPKLKHKVRAVCYYYKQQKTSFIVILPYHKNTRHCYRYDTAEDKWSKLTTYPNGFDPGFCRCAVDETNQLLYLFGGSNDIFATFDLKTSKWDIKCTGSDKQKVKYYNIPHSSPVALAFIYEPIHKLHIFCNVGHIKYDNNQQKFISASKNGCNYNAYLSGPSMCYVPKKQLLLILGGYKDGCYSDEIYCTQITTKDDDDYQWSLLKNNPSWFSNKSSVLKLPVTADSINVVVVFDIVVMIHKSNQFIYCLDFGAASLKWIKCKIEKVVANTICFVAQENCIHFIDIHSEQHQKMDVSKLLPSKIYNKYAFQSVGNHDDMKCNQCDSLIKEKNNLQTLVNDLLSNQNELESAKNDALKKSVEWKQKYIQIQSLLQKNKNKQNELLHKLSEINDEYKEAKLEINELKKELVKLKQMEKIDLSNYLNWNADDVVDWIISLNGAKYAIYEQTVRQLFNAEGVVGAALSEIEKQDLKGWGITNFMDRSNLYKEIQQLIKQNNEKDIQNEQEGNTAYI